MAARHTQRARQARGGPSAHRLNTKDLADLAPEMPPGESDWSPVDFTLIRVADTGPHEPALAFGCQRINKDRPGFAGEIERRASIPVGSSIPCAIGRASCRESGGQYV